ncbi:poly(A) RNA polymerase gld-2 homolog A [Drosophila eugracilis]|uniref:poly(A) RNA polymerase gld-2 homolog A n=1 Tax=Drosophila eugracilis TaxID=29029 RepID=UPI001BD93BDF|nr:poly(A) RNA polymerase gld-2 homolog A [Drosophila eugracilis]
MSTALAMAAAASSGATAAATAAAAATTTTTISNTTASPATNTTTTTTTVLNTTTKIEEGAGAIAAPKALETEESGKDAAEDLESGAPKPRRQRKTTIVHTCPRPPGGYKYSMEFLYGIGSGMAGMTLNIPTPSSITPRTMRTTPPLLTNPMPLLSTMGVATPRTAGFSSSGMRYPAGVGTAGAKPATATAAAPAAATAAPTTPTTSTGSGAEGVTGSVAPGGLPTGAAAMPAAQFIYQGYLPTGPQRRLWHTENAVWQFDRNYPYNQAYSSQYGIPMMPVGFEHPYGQRIIYPGYFNQATGGIHAAAVPGMARTNRHVAQQPQLLAQPAVGTETSEEAVPSIGNAPQVSSPWRYGRPGAQRGSGRQALPAATSTTVIHRDSKTFYNSITGGMGGGPRFKAPFVANSRNFQAGAVTAGGEATAAAVATNSATAGAASPSDQNLTNKQGNRGASSNNYSRNRNKRGGKSSASKDHTSHSSGSLSNSSSKSHLDRRHSSSTSISTPKHPNRTYRNRMRYNVVEPAEPKPVTPTSPVSTYQPPPLPQPGSRRAAKFQGANTYQGQTANRQQSRYYQSRHMDGCVYQPGHYMIGATGAPVLGSTAAAAAPGVGGGGVQMAGVAGGGITGSSGGGAATVTASSANSEGEQPLESDFDQRQELADLGLDPANGGLSSDLEPLGFKQDTSELDANSLLQSRPSSEVDGDDGHSFVSLALSVESDVTESDLSDASVESVVRNIMVSCLALATGAQEPDLSGPNLVPYGDMHHLKELEKKSQPTGPTNGYRCQMQHHHSYRPYHPQLSPRGMSCCGDMLSQPSDDLVFKLDQQDVFGNGKRHLKEIAEEHDDNSVESNLSCTPSASSSKSDMPGTAAKANIIMIEETSEDELPLVIHNRYWREFFGYTPADRFLLRAKLVEMKRPPKNEANRKKWEPLSLSIWKKFLDAQQTRHVYKTKMRLWRSIYTVAMTNYPRYGLYLVGSSISNFGSKCSDMDICMLACTNPNIDPRMEAVYHLQLMKDLLNHTNMFQDFNLIEARVPILRFTDRQHKVEVDINFNNSVGIRNTHLLYCYSQLDWRVRPMALTVKQWAQYHNINNAKNMTISSYSLMLMVIHFLQVGVNPPVLPCLHKLYPDKFGLLQPSDFGYVDMNEVMPPYQSENTQSLGELLLSFLHYYSMFEYGKYAISIRVGGVLPIEVCRVATAPKNDIHQWNELCIEEPFDQTNTARSVYDSDTFERIRAIFMASYRRLDTARTLNSIFEGYDGPTILMQQATLDSENEFFDGQNQQMLANRGSSRSTGKMTSSRPSTQMVDKASTAIWDEIKRKADSLAGKCNNNNNDDDTNSESAGTKNNISEKMTSKDDSVRTEPPIA